MTCSYPCGLGATNVFGYDGVAEGAVGGLACEVEVGRVYELPNDVESE